MRELPTKVKPVCNEHKNKTTIIKHRDKNKTVIIKHRDNTLSNIEITHSIKSKQLFSNIEITQNRIKTTILKYRVSIITAKFYWHLIKHCIATILSTYTALTYKINNIKSHISSPSNTNQPESSLIYSKNQAGSTLIHSKYGVNYVNLLHLNIKSLKTS